MKRLALAIIFVLGFAPPAWADFQDGVAAYNRGDYATAYREMKPLAEQSFAMAQFNLGILYANGRGVPQDDAEAVKWYRKAAGQGVAIAQYNLGLKYSRGEGVAQDYAEAAKWYRKAAEQGVAEAQHNLGVMYYNGLGVPQDYVQAHKWSNLAALRLPPGKERDIAVKNRNIAAARMTAGQITTRKTIRSIQTNLAALGYNPGSADGILGPQTRNAIEAFQRDHDLPVTGPVAGEASARLDLRALADTLGVHGHDRRSSHVSAFVGAAPRTSAVDAR